MRTLGNILWLVLAGFWLAVGYALAGIVMFVLIVTIPFGIQAFKLASYALWPFGRTVVEQPDDNPALGCIGNVIWVVVVGWELAVAHLVTGVALCLTIVGIPLGLACFKMIPLALLPFGKEIVPVDRLPPGAPVYHAPATLGAGRPSSPAGSPR